MENKSQISNQYIQRISNSYNNTNMKKSHILLLGILLVAFSQAQSITLLQCSKVGNLVSNGCVCPAGSSAITISSTIYCLPIATTSPTPTTTTFTSTAASTTTSASTSTTTSGSTSTTTTSTATTTTADPNCKLYASRVCTECKDGFVLTQTKSCMLKSPLCADYGTGSTCITCQPDFELHPDGLCYPIITPSQDPTEPTDPNCLVADDKNKKICIKCVYRAYLDMTTGICKQVNPLCDDHDANGNCISCWPGYAVDNGSCVMKALPTPPNCNKINSQGVCLVCSSDSYMDANRNCIQKDPNCKSYTNDNTGCINCYPGFIVDKSTNKCTPNPDPYCFATQGDRCVTCSKGFYLDNGVCKQNDPLCKESENGKCNSCYVGYALQDNKCIRVTNLMGASTLYSNCKTVDSTGKCTECSYRFYLNYNKECIKVSDFCQTYEKDRGYCTSCYKGYRIDPRTGDCTISKL